MKKQITIKQFQRLQKLESIKGLSDSLEKRMLIASIISGKSVKKLKQMDLMELTKFSDKIVSQYDFEFKPKAKKDSIIVDDKKYYIVTDLHKIISGQLIDLSQYAKEEDSIVDNLHYIVAIMLREDKHSYDGSNLDKRAEIMKEHCPYNDIYDIAVFFCKLLSRLPKILEDQMRKSLQNISNNGAGSSI